MLCELKLLHAHIPCKGKMLKITEQHCGVAPSHMAIHTEILGTIHGITTSQASVQRTCEINGFAFITEANLQETEG